MKILPRKCTYCQYNGYCELQEFDKARSFKCIDEFEKRIILANQGRDNAFLVKQSK